ncbi:MAG: CoA transferase [Alphaproteobacteria bacterium]|nr:CoA transferase [Alphaproteobacteria bacterium]MCB9929539.1 CoA transferase [Alphaproteobacteria bacterium]
MSKPLSDLLVLSLEQAVAAPHLTCRMADAGARVIKLERADGAGDFARGYDQHAHGMSSYFVWLNRGKESLAIDIKQPDDLALLHRMLAQADVWVQNLAPGAMERAGLGSEALRAQYPRLITVDISGYGDAGAPYNEMKAYDLLVQAESGITAITGSPEEPGRVGVSICDLTTGLNAYTAVLEAVIDRAKTGKGSGVKASLFGSMADWMAAPLMAYEQSDTIWPRNALRHPLMCPYGAFPTSDGSRTLVACQNEREWQRFCEHVLQDKAFAKHPQAETNVVRVANRPFVEGRIEETTRQITREEFHARLRQGDIAYGAVNEIPDVSRHGALRRITVGTPNGDISYPAPPTIRGEARDDYGPAPGYDEHGARLRSEFAG